MSDKCWNRSRKAAVFQKFGVTGGERILYDVWVEAYLFFMRFCPGIRQGTTDGLNVAFLEHLSHCVTYDMISMWIDRRVWRKLPEVMLEQVLSHLPLSAILRFKAVCKHWNILLNSVEFCNSYAHTTAEESYVVFIPIHVQQLTLCPLYNPFLNKWCHVDRSSPLFRSSTANSRCTSTNQTRRHGNSSSIFRKLVHSACRASPSATLTTLCRCMTLCSCNTISRKTHHGFQAP